MNKITMEVGSQSVEMTAEGVKVGYGRTLSHEDFNAIIAAYKLLGFYRDTGLTLAAAAPAPASAASEGDAAITVPAASPEEI